MNDPTTQIDLSPYMPLACGVFLIVATLAIVNTHRLWNKVADPFRTHKKLEFDSKYNCQFVRIDGCHFRHLVVMPTEEGLYLSSWGFLPQLMMPKRVMIPWHSISRIYSEQRSALGFTVDEYYLNVESTQKIKLKIPNAIAKEIIQRNFIQPV